MLSQAGNGIGGWGGAAGSGVGMVGGVGGNSRVVVLVSYGVGSAAGCCCPAVGGVGGFPAGGGGIPVATEPSGFVLLDGTA